jgi:hypothetical protein
MRIRCAQELDDPGGGQTAEIGRKGMVPKMNEVDMIVVEARDHRLPAESPYFRIPSGPLEHFPIRSDVFDRIAADKHGRGPWAESSKCKNLSIDPRDAPHTRLSPWCELRSRFQTYSSLPIGSIVRTCRS